MQRAVAIYLGPAFGFSWGCAELYDRLIQGRLGEARVLGDALLGLLFMYGPAVGGSDLLRGPAGLACCLVLACGCLLLAWLRRPSAPPIAAAAP
jgi:hypothetical protein